MNSSSFQVSNLMHANWNTRQAMVSWNPTVALDIGSQKKVKHIISINIRVLQRNIAAAPQKENYYLQIMAGLAPKS